MKMVALLRGINVGGNRLIPMPALCQAATRAGLLEVRSYIQSGNLVFDAGERGSEETSELLEKAILKKFGHEVDVMVRTKKEWARDAKRNPFLKSCEVRPNLVLLGFSKTGFRKADEGELKKRATQGEEVKIVGDALWIDYVKSVGKSKLNPAFLEKVIGSPVTLRNWNTVLQLLLMLESE